MIPGDGPPGEVRPTLRSDRADEAIRSGIDTLADAVGGTSPFATIIDMCRRSEMQAVAAVARQLGFTPDEDAVAEALAAVDMGTDPVAAMAGACGMVARPVTLPADWFFEDGAPAIVTVIDGAGDARIRAMAWRRGWRFIDTADGGHEVLGEGDVSAVSRQAVELVPRLPDAPAAQRDLRRFCLRGSRPEWVVLGATSAVVGVVAFATPLVIGQLGAAVTVGASAGALLGLFVALICMALALAFWRAIRSAAVSRLRSRIEARAFAALWDRSVRQPLPWHETRPTSQRARRVLAMDRAATAVNDDVVSHLLDAIVILGSLVAIATTTVPLLLGIGGSLVVEAVVLWLLVRNAGARAGHQGSHSRVASAQIGEAVAQIDELRAWGAEAFSLRAWATAQAPAAAVDQQTRRNTMQRMVVGAIWPVLTLAVLVAVSAFGDTTFAQFVTAQTAAVAATMTLATVMSAVNAWLIGKAVIQRVDPLLAAVPESGEPTVGIGAGAIEVRGLTYQVGEGEPVLSDVSFTVGPGEFVVVTGAMGCGKSLLVQCVLGLTTPAMGSVLVDDQDLAALDGDVVRRQIGSVLQLQGTPLLPTTIRDNVTLGRALTSDQIWTALDEVGIGEDVRSMALGLDTPTTNGGRTLSSGQRQQILLARALVGDPRMLVWDAALTALDPAALRCVLDALTARPVTRVVVSQHAEVVARADRVILLSEGRVVDIGARDDLLARSQLFRDLMGFVPA